MNVRRRLLWLALNAIAVIAIASPWISVRAAPSGTFTPYIANTQPQRALGDFDGDGRVDTAFIQERAGTARISIHLSGSSSPVDLEGAVTAVVQGDVDRDGDLDLVAATPSGGLLIWINDGRGRFTRQLTSGTRSVSREPVVVQTTWYEAPAISVGALPPPSAVRCETAPVVARIRVTSAQCPNGVNPSVPLPLRAPPVRLL